MHEKYIKKTIECKHCKESYTFKVREAGLEAWKDGEFCQEALHDLEHWQRELLISGTCNDCFDKLFPPEN
jgi:hypothetical protein|tara:strand:+ start:705 stop:914 length:210 start_codon:yes stop_codon:yes gene_type:complete